MAGTVPDLERSDEAIPPAHTRYEPDRSLSSQRASPVPNKVTCRPTVVSVSVHCKYLGVRSERRLSCVTADDSATSVVRNNTDRYVL